MTAREFVTRLAEVRPDGQGGWFGRCPIHDDKNPSVHVSTGDDGRILVDDFGGCETEAIVKAVGLTMADLFPTKTRSRRRARGEGGPAPGDGATGATAQPPSEGCTLAQYAQAKRLPLDWLRTLGLQDLVYLNRPAIRIPYRDADSQEAAVQFRVSLTGEDRFRWRKGDKACLYGLWRIAEARQRAMTVLCEGSSDVHTLWRHGVPAIGLPGATGWRDAWAPLFDGIATLYVVIEPDQGGQAVLKALGASKLRDRVRLIMMPAETKDPSALYLADPSHFRSRWRVLMKAAEPWPTQAARQRQARAAAAWTACQDLAQEPQILDRFAKALRDRGVIGEERAGRLIYLILVTRVLARPVSAVVKGPSASGKNFLVNNVLAFFPPSSYFDMTAMSERALLYLEESLAHRFLVLYEAHALEGAIAAYATRSLLSEGRLRYPTVMKIDGQMKSVVLTLEGPTGLLTTTTAVRLHPENETRLFSIATTDTTEQTQAILAQQGQNAVEGSIPAPDSAPADWGALQVWLAEGAEHRVRIPYAARLAALIPPLAVRLRRDVPAVLGLIGAHALLHQATRDRDAKGQVLATAEDYASVRELVAELVAEGVEASVSPTIRETVETVQILLDAMPGPLTDETGVTVTAVGERLHLDRSTASRRVRVAVTRGYLKNLETRKGRPARLRVGDPLPGEVVVLPPPEALLEGGARSPLATRHTVTHQAGQTRPGVTV
jgi:hypothetical protein